MRASSNGDEDESPSNSYSKKACLAGSSHMIIKGNMINFVKEKPDSQSMSTVPKMSSSTASSLMESTDRLNSSSISFSSNPDYDSTSSANEIEEPYRSNYDYDQFLSGEQTDRHLNKRKSSSPNSFTPPFKKMARKHDSSSLPTPPSTGGSNKVSKMMKNMGYDDKKGLGRNAQGPTALIEESKQKGHRGLGYTVAGFADPQMDWDFDEDPAPVDEEIYWCPIDLDAETPLDFETIRRWIKLEPKKTVIDDEFDFADEEILKSMLLAKTIFDELPQKEMEEARARSNVYEIIGQSVFLNRAAVKIANIDSVFGRMFTEPKGRNGKSLIDQDEPFYFADICAGPGGFSEYILWKKKWQAKGFGFTLKGACDFNLRKFVVGHPETFDPFYGVKGIDGDGDIYKLENIDALQEYVYKNTNNHGVHIVMADGGFSVEGQENIQEILSKQLYLCQFLTALSILRPGGNFVCKLFDLFTPFSVGLIYLMYRAFDQISIHKPVTSRPANSERYIICNGLRKEVGSVVRQYFYEINRELHRCQADSKNLDIRFVVPLEILKGNRSFYNYIQESNNRIGELQIRNLKKIRAFVSNTNLRDDRQGEIRSQCLARWELPDEPRQKARKIHLRDVQMSLFSLLGNGFQQFLYKTPSPLTQAILDGNQIQSLFDYRCVLSIGEPILLLSCGTNSVFYKSLTNPRNDWLPLERISYKIELPPNTFLLAELVTETFRDQRTERRKRAIYIIDVYFIGSENLIVENEKPTVFIDRNRWLKKFEKVINKPCRTDLVPIRISEQLRLEQMDDQLKKLIHPDAISQIDSEQLTFVNRNIDPPATTAVQGLWIFKFVQTPWTILLSRTRNNKYFYNHKNRVSSISAPADSSHIASLSSMMESSFYWNFYDRQDPLRKSTFMSFIEAKNREVHEQPTRAQQT